MTTKERQLTAVIAEVRSCFNRLKMLAEQLHRDLAVNPSMRAVMEHLAAGGRQTVPDIAKQKSVSRQHIQKVMNALVDGEFVRSVDNPGHQRSPYFELTPLGQHTVGEIREREQEPLRRLAGVTSQAALTQTLATLHDLNEHLEKEIENGESDE